jgi:GT2 family glycosyltransferase
LEAEIIVVDNASTDNSGDLVAEKYHQVTLLKNSRNLGFAGGVNTGIKYALEIGVEYIALINNDAVAENHWLKTLVAFMDKNTSIGIATSKIIDASKSFYDSTGDLYTVWGLPYPRGRGEPLSGKYDNYRWVFGASGGASIYRAEMLQQVGIFDEAFFAYYEDVDLSFRAQLAGWKIAYVPEAIVHHEIGATSSQIKGFATYHTLKNLPLLLWKNVPWRLMPKVWPRLALAYLFIAGSALRRGQIWPFLKGITMGTILWPRSLVQRFKIQRSRKVSVKYINSIITHDLPPNAKKLRALRSRWRDLLKKT